MLQMESCFLVLLCTLNCCFFSQTSTSTLKNKYLYIFGYMTCIYECITIKLLLVDAGKLTHVSFFVHLDTCKVH